LRQTILTPRLELRGGTPETFAIPFDDRAALERALDAHVPADWPVENYDQSVLDWCRGKLAEAPESGPPIRYMILRPARPAALVGLASAVRDVFRRPPRGNDIVDVIRSESNTLIGIFGDGYRTDPGTLVIGYSILPGYRRRGYASEALAVVIGEAFAKDDVTRIIADTYPDRAASIGVLEKNGFRYIGDGEEAGVIRYERTR